LQPWASQQRKRKRALAPGVCSPVRAIVSRSARRFVAATGLIFLLTPIPIQAQLPAGTTDATQSQTQKQDPLLTQANEALDKHDYPTALKLLTTLTEKFPNDPHLL